MSSDSRFARLKTDPRFRRPRKKQTKVVVDDRFKSIFDDGKKKKGKKNTGKQVDKYGRSVSSTQEQDNLRRFYRLENEEEGSDTPDQKPVVDYARGGVLLESSDEEEQAIEDESDDDGVVTLGQDQTRPIAIPRDEDELEIDLDEDDFADLDAQAQTALQAQEEQEQEAKPQVQPSRRLAAVNMDWDHVRAHHLFKIFSSLVSPTAASASSAIPVAKRGGAAAAVRGRLLNVKVYPSEFGKKRMAREEVEGPPAEVFRKKRNEDEEVNETNVYELGGEDEVDEDALRKYQIDRMRYHYAIAEFDTIQAAEHVFNELEGTELERSANVFDLSYVPEDMTFDDEPRDEASEDVTSSNYKGLDFVTDALRHSRVKLTWDEDDPERNRITRRAYSKKDVDEIDYTGLIASSEDESGAEDGANVQKTKPTKNAERDRLRALLLGGDTEATLPEGWGGAANDDKGDVDMEITFAPGLSESKEEEETTLEAYQRKMREKRKKRKEEVKNKDKGKEREAEGSGMPAKDDFFASESEREEQEEAGAAQKKGGKRGKTKQKRALSPEGKSARTLSTAEELALLTTADGVDKEPQHFDMKAVIRAEKTKGRKGKKWEKKKGGQEDLQEDFAINVKDERFKALHEDHTFAIDPSNPHFKKTKAMTALLDERTKRRTKDVAHGEREQQIRDVSVQDGRDLQKLVDSVKRKSVGAQPDSRGTGKRRKM